MINQRNPAPVADVKTFCRKFSLSTEEGRDVRTFDSPALHRKFAEHGHHASKAVHEMCALKTGAIAEFIDAQLAPNERPILYCRLVAAYKLLEHCGFATE